MAREMADMADLTRDLVLDKPFNVNIERAIYRGPAHWIVEASWLSSPGEYPATRVVFSGVDTVTSRYDDMKTSTQAGPAGRRQRPGIEPDLVSLRATHDAIERRLRRIAGADHRQLTAQAAHQNYYEIAGLGEFLPVDRMWIKNTRPGQWTVAMGRVEESPGIFRQETFTFTFTGTGLVAEEEHYTETSPHTGPDAYPRFGGGGSLNTIPRPPGP